MAVKIRIMASHAKRGRAPVPRLVYRAEAYEEDDQFAERQWSCAHDHESMEHALNCGMEWLSGHEGGVAAEPA